MQPLPTKGRIHTERVRVGPADVDTEGLAHLGAIADWLQEAAFADVLEAGLTSSSSWIVRRTLMRIERRPRFGEEIGVSTFCSGLAKSVAERRTSISGDEGVAIEAEAIWVQVDPETRMPARFSEEFMAVYAATAAGRRARSRLRHPAAPADGSGCERRQWSFRAADLDIAGHVNNAVYWQIAEQHLEGALGPGEVEVEFRHGAGVGSATLLVDGEMLWVLDADGETSASLRCGPGPAS